LFDTPEKMKYTEHGSLEFETGAGESSVFAIFKKIIALG
jgi:hypothetical protein